MRGRVLWVFGLVVVATALAAGIRAEERTFSTDKGTDRPAAREITDTPKTDVSMEMFPVEPGTVFQRVEVFAEGAETEAVATGTPLIYSNTQGNIAVATGLNFVADDIALVSGVGCRARKYVLPVLGKVNPVGTGGPYSIDFALYSNCPGAIPSNPPGASVIIPGSAGHLDFPDDGPRTIIFNVPGAGAVLPTNNVWFGVRFNRSNAGLLVGSPPEEGGSGDEFDFPGFPCRGALGGFPDRPHASFNLQIFGGKTCTSSFVGYKNNMASGTVINPGTNVWLIDDIFLGASECQMIAYEVILRGVGFYELEMRRNCEGNVINGTQKIAQIGQGNDPTRFRFTFDPPIDLPDEFHFATRVQNDTGGIITSGQQADIGVTSDAYSVPTDPPNIVCIEFEPGPPPSPLPPGIHGGVNVMITCAGDPPVGACCDMFFTRCVGGADDGKLCCAPDVDAGAFCYEDLSRVDAYPPCAAPGLCESTCSSLPQMNCPFPPRFSQLRPAWVPDETCLPDPFFPACGKAACCEPDDECHNLTVNECEAVPPVESLRQWQQGQTCGPPQHCPLNACLGRQGECLEARDCPPNDPEDKGCEIIPCCDRVCRLGALGRFCCDTCWDSTCVELAIEFCDEPPPNDECAPFGRSEGATTLPCDSATRICTGFTEARKANPNVAGGDPDDPAIGCYGGSPGTQGLQTVWYKWTALATERARVQTCNSSAPANDSLLVVYAVGDPTDDITSCNSLIPIACNDDFAQCGTPTHSRTCIYAVAGQEYYAMVASKVLIDNRGAGYRIEVRPTTSSTCPSDPNNNYCLNVTCPDLSPPGGCITDGVTAFDFTPSNANYFYDLDTPVDPCIPTTTADMWFNYNATCTGALTAHTCGASAAASPDTNLAIYDGCTNCPPYATGAPLGCNSDAGGEPCGDSAKAVADVIEGNCYTIRLGDSSLSLPTGNLTVSCEQADCPGGAMTFIDPPEGAVDAGRPHDPNDANQLLGIQTITAQGTPNALASCFALCETVAAGSPNLISNIVEDPPGTYTLTLARPITPGAKTTIRYTDTHGNVSALHLAAHPANVRSDAFATSQDVQDLSAVLAGTCVLPCAAPWDVLSTDLDRSGMVTGADILDAADFLAGVGAYAVWNNTPNPINSLLCP